MSYNVLKCLHVFKMCVKRLDDFHVTFVDLKIIKVKNSQNTHMRE